MPSSISNSEPAAPARGPLRYIVALLAMLVLGHAIIEFGTTWVTEKYGRHEVGWVRERKAAGDLVHDGKGVLLIGSSVLFGVDQPQLQKEAPDWTVRRIVMVGTFYSDWDYTLRRLIREGVKPDYVVLTPLPFQIYGDTFAGDYMALHWIDRRDILDLAERKKLDRTATFNLLFASHNSFFALRDTIRTALLGHVVPGSRVLAAGGANKRVYKGGEIEKIVGDRLAELQSRLAEQGSRLIVLHYPATGLEDSWKVVKRVADARDIPYLSAVDSLPRSDFEDALHLNAHGTEVFTRALGPVLERELNRLRSKAQARK